MGVGGVADSAEELGVVLPDRQNGGHLLEDDHVVRLASPEFGLHDPAQGLEHEAGAVVGHLVRLVFDLFPRGLELLEFVMAGQLRGKCLDLFQSLVALTVARDGEGLARRPAGEDVRSGDLVVARTERGDIFHRRGQKSGRPTRCTGRVVPFDADALYFVHDRGGDVETTGTCEKIDDHEFRTRE